MLRTEVAIDFLKLIKEQIVQPRFAFIMLALTVIAACVMCTAVSVPILSIDGFSWAENLAFDGIGGLFVSESVRGQLWRISLNHSTGNYSTAVHVAKDFKQFGGLAPTSDGKYIFAAAVFDDKKNGIISVSTKPSAVGEQTFQVINQNMAELANGMALVSSKNALYCTAEKGTLSKVDIATGQEIIISDSLSKPDGLWFDQSSNLLIIGELLSKKIKLYNIATSAFSEYFAGASSLNALHMLDDFTLVGAMNSDLGKSVLVGADWTGKQILQFTLDGTVLKTVPLPEGISLYEPTSIRLGRGPGFDPNAYYITEGGGLTRNVNNRRVMQLPTGVIPL